MKVIKVVRKTKIDGVPSLVSATATGQYRKVYSIDGHHQVVDNALCFTDIVHAKSFRKGRLIQEIWEADCETAEAASHVVIPRYLHHYTKACLAQILRGRTPRGTIGWSAIYIMKAPEDTMICTKVLPTKLLEG